MRRATIAPAGITILWRTLTALFVALSLWPGSSDVQGATITSIAAPASSSDPKLAKPARTLRLSGPIETGDAEKLGKVLAGLPASTVDRPDQPLTVLELSSLGGSLAEGFEIGKLLRKSNVIGVVRKGDICLSACALALLGGNMHHLPSAEPNECNVEPGSKVAFHNFWLNQNGLRAITSADPVASRIEGFNDARGGAASFALYVSDMGLPASFVGKVMGRPPEEFQYIETAEEFLYFRLCMLGLGRPKTELGAQAANVCNHSLGGPSAKAPLEIWEIPAADARRHLLELVQKNMEAFKSKGRLADQLASGAVMRVQPEIDRLYDDLRSAGVALPEIVGPTFEIGRGRGDTYETLCYVSLSTTDPDNFDVVVRGAKGLVQPTRMPPENSRRLFLYDNKDVLNPRP
jgi:hypothetical protein